MKELLKMKMPNGKWWTFGSIAINKWGNKQAGFKVTNELKALIANAQLDSWVNMAVFEEQEQASQPKVESQVEDDEVPFAILIALLGSLLSPFLGVV